VIVLTQAPNALGSALTVVGDEWNLLLVQQALLGRRRYSDFQAALGIGPTVLSQRLSGLVDAGVMEKAGREGYVLTACGTSLWPVLLSIWAWEQEWVQGQALPTMRHLDCGRVFVPELACAACRSLVERGDVDVRWGPSGVMERSVPRGSLRRRSSGDRPGGAGLFPETMTLIGNRWSAAVLGAAFLGARRFSEFESALGAPPNVVTERLRSFVAVGVLDDGYVLTTKGRALFATVAMTVRWGERWFPAAEGPALISRHLGCGAAFLPVLLCSACEAGLHRRDIAVEGAP
jgi:DNA-binding HxlR family transcriptional regulator